jgi:hypothetical protein
MSPVTINILVPQMNGFGANVKIPCLMTGSNDLKLIQPSLKSAAW